MAFEWFSAFWSFFGTVGGVRRSVFIISTVFLVLVCVAAVVVLVTRGNSIGKSKSTTPRPPSSTAANLTPEPVKQVPLLTLPSGELAPMGTSIVVQELPGACADAVAPLRKLMVDYKSGYVIDQRGVEIQNKATGVARQACSKTDFERFMNDEFLGWMAPAPVPTS